MEEKQTNIRLKKPVLIATAVLAGVVLLYVGLCAFVSLSGTVLPGVYADRVKLGGLSQEQAVRHLDDWVGQMGADEDIVLSHGEQTVSIAGPLVDVDSEAVARQAWMLGRGNGFLGGGAALVGRIFGGPVQVDCPVHISPEGQEKLDGALDELSAGVDTPLVETVWVVEGTTLVITKGVSGVALDREKAQVDLLARLMEQRSDVIVVEQLVARPEELDVQELYAAIFREPRDAAVDEQTYRVIAHEVGLSFEPETVQTQFAALAEGESMQVTLTVTLPELTREKLQKLLFADVLGECTTSISGTANRLNNVQVAAAALNNVVIMPGGEFSYNATLGPRTLERGYKGAPAYVGGKTVDEVGGGICQNSSTLYLAALYANLEMVERRNHMYAVGYVPDGLDATVAYNAIDFRFRNNTGYPIRVEAVVNGRTLTVRLHGTRTNEFTVKMETERVSTTNYKTIYKEDPSVPAGTTVVDTTPYTGRKVLAYRCVYDGQGNLISRTLESTNTYRHRDKVVLYSPADAHQYTGEGKKPVEPDVPAVPDTPDVPQTPSAPDTPVVPDAPAVPDVPEDTQSAATEEDLPSVEVGEVTQEAQPSEQSQPEDAVPTP